VGTRQRGVEGEDGEVRERGGERGKAGGTERRCVGIQGEMEREMKKGRR